MDELAMLATLPAFRGTESRELATLATKLVRLSRPAKSLILRERELADGLYVVLRGRVHLARSLPGGREIILGSLGPGEIFGETVVVDNLAMTCSAITSLPSELARIPGEVVSAFTVAHPESLRGLMGSLAARMSDVEAVASDLALCDVESRLRRLLVQLARRQGRPAMEAAEGWVLAPVPTQSELARMVGSCRETVSRTLTSMAKAGDLIARGRRLTVRPQLMARFPSA